MLKFISNLEARADRFKLSILLSSGESKYVSWGGGGLQASERQIVYFYFFLTSFFKHNKQWVLSRKLCLISVGLQEITAGVITRHEFAPQSFSY